MAESSLQTNPPSRDLSGPGGSVPAILVVDDDPTCQKVLRRMLERLGHPCVVVGTAEEAIETAMSGPFRLILMDLDLPGKSGLDAAHELRNGVTRVRRIAIVAVTAHATEPGPAPDDQPMDYVLPKPVSSRDLAVAIETFASLLAKGRDSGILPVVTPATVAPPPPPPATILGRPVPPSAAAALRILVMEDDPVIQRLYKAVLGAEGLGFDMAVDGSVGIERARETRYDLILSDLSMPVTDGFRAAEVIRGNDGPNRATPIVAVTALDVPGTRERCIGVGINDFVVKPVNRDRLRQTLHHWLPSLTSEQATPPPTGAAERPVQAASLASLGSSFPASFTPASPADWRTEPVFDRTRIEELETLASREDPDIALSLARNFLDEFPAALERMREAWVRGEHESCRSVAHMHKSRSGSVGARRIQALCALVQRDITEGNTCEVPSSLDAMESCFVEYRTRLLQAYPDAGDQP